MNAAWWRPAVRRVRCVGRASATSARFSESGSDRPLEPDGTSAAVSITSGRTAVPFHIQDIVTSFAINGQVLRHTALKVEKYTLQNGGVLDLRRLAKAAQAALRFKGIEL